ncbi:MAG: hypothetical protein AAF429_15715 [Pseudomonadota bacterium]
MKKLILAAGIFVTMSGCSAVLTAGAANLGSSPEGIKKATANYFNVSERSVKISNLSRGPFGAGYKAQVKGVLYNCGMTYGSVACERPGR